MSLGSEVGRLGARKERLLLPSGARTGTLTEHGFRPYGYIPNLERSWGSLQSPGAINTTAAAPCRAVPCRELCMNHPVDLPTILGGRSFYHPHWADEDPRAPGRSYSWKMTKLFKETFPAGRSEDSSKCLPERKVGRGL